MKSAPAQCVAAGGVNLGTQADNMQDMVSKGRNRDTSGKNNGRAKISPEQVIEIRQRYMSGGVRQVDLAVEFGVSQVQIGNIVRGVSWVRT